MAFSKISRHNVKPGDIIISVGTLDPNQSIEDLKKGFNKYSHRSYERLVPLLNPVKIGQKLISHSSSGHNDSVHAGVCLGLDENKNPIITDLHGYVQDISIDNYYIPTTLRVFRPNIDPNLFEKARENLLTSSRVDEKNKWEKRDYRESNTFFIPGRLDAKWNQEVKHALKIATNLSNFINDNNSTTKLDEQMICSKLVIQTYKMILSEVEKELGIKKNTLIKSYMSLLKNTTPKTLEGYLVNNKNYSQYIIPTVDNLFDQIKTEIDALEHNELSVFYSKLQTKLAEKKYDQYTKSMIFVHEADKAKLKLPEKLTTFLISQGIIPGESNITIETKLNDIDKLTDILTDEINALKNNIPPLSFSQIHTNNMNINPEINLKEQKLIFLKELRQCIENTSSLEKIDLVKINSLKIKYPNALQGHTSRIKNLVNELEQLAEKPVLLKQDENISNQFRVK